MTTYPTPICMFCIRRYEEELACTAFPDGIPAGIIQSRLDHRKPVPGDNGILFEAKDKDGELYAQLLFKTIEAENA